jgi:hypothetical protein
MSSFKTEVIYIRLAFIYVTTNLRVTAHFKLEINGKADSPITTCVSWRA